MSCWRCRAGAKSRSVHPSQRNAHLILSCDTPPRLPRYTHPCSWRVLSASAPPSRSIIHQVAPLLRGVFPVNQASSCYAQNVISHASRAAAGAETLINSVISAPAALLFALIHGEVGSLPWLSIKYIWSVCINSAVAITDGTDTRQWPEWFRWTDGSFLYYCRWTVQWVSVITTAGSRGRRQ